MDCNVPNDSSSSIGLRIASIFVIFVTSLLGTCLPLFGKRLPVIIMYTAKFFGSGVIIATAFIHLLSPAFEELGASCLTGVWQVYPWPAALAMLAVFGMFLMEFACTRYGMHLFHAMAQPALLARQETEQPSQGDAEDDNMGKVVEEADATKTADSLDLESGNDAAEALASNMVDESASAQILAVMILEFGIVFHSVIIGLSLAVSGDNFVTLFVVLIFHQGFEGLGLGARLAFLPLPSKYRWVPWTGALLYAAVTPLGIAIGLGVRTSYDDTSAASNIVQGVIDSLSAGILLYTGLVELLAREFLFNPDMRKVSDRAVTFYLGMIFAGAALMSFLGYYI